MEKIGKFGVFKFESLEDFIHLYDSSKAWLGSDIVFRGQSSSKWGLSTSIERLAKDCLPELPEMEKEIVTDFKKTAHHYISSEYPNDNNYLEWLALIQHYGGPTRLIDFTKSLFISAYFATDNPGEDGEIWSINNNHLQLNYSNLAESKSKEYLDLIQLVKDCDYSDFNYSYNFKNTSLTPSWVDALYPNFIKATLNNVTGLEKHKGIIKLEPDRHNKRLNLQKGLFYLPIDITSRFEENLKSAFNIESLNIPDDFKSVKSLLRLEFSDYSVSRLIIPKSLKPRIRLFLDNININAKVLFPDLEGLIKSLNEKVSNWKINRGRFIRRFDSDEEMWKEFALNKLEIEEYINKKNDKNS